jgi:site-specific DNA-methyltransferase (adenine-specific)
MSLPKPYYEDDAVTIFNCDCREILPELEAESVDLVFTSPPYNLGTSTGGGFPGRVKLGHYPEGARLGKRGGMGKWSGGTLANGYGAYTDAMPLDEYIAWQKEILAECWQALGPAGAIFYNHKPRILDGELLTPLTYNPGLPVRQVIIWARAGGVNFSPAFYCPTHEWVLVLARPAFRLKSKAASGVGDVWRIPQEANTPHPAPFPLALPMRAIETTPATTVLDPFMGSGTTLLAAKNLGRRAIGVEIEEKYCQIAAERLSQEVLPLEVL